MPTFSSLFLAGAVNRHSKGDAYGQFVYAGFEALAGGKLRLLPQLHTGIRSKHCGQPLVIAELRPRGGLLIACEMMLETTDQIPSQPDC